MDRFEEEHDREAYEARVRTIRAEGGPSDDWRIGELPEDEEGED